VILDARFGHQSIIPTVKILAVPSEVFV